MLFCRLQGYHRDILEHWTPPPPAGATEIVHPPPPVADKTLQTSGNVTTPSSVTDPLNKTHWAPPPPPEATEIIHPPPPVADQTLQTSGNITTPSSVADPSNKTLSKRGRGRKSKRHRKVIGT